MGNFTDAISDTEMRLKIQQSRRKVFNEAMKVAVELEAFETAERQWQCNKYVRGTSCSSVVAESSTETSAILKKLDKLLALNETKETPNGAIEESKSKPRCYKCKLIGHIQRNCPQKENESTASTVSETITGGHAFVNRVGGAFERKWSRKKENQYRQVSERVVEAGIYLPVNVNGVSDMTFMPGCLVPSTKLYR